MSQSTVTILSALLAIITTFAFNTGNFLLGAITLIAHGGLTLYVGPSRWKRVLGGCMIAFGLYVLALVLGLLVDAVAALRVREMMAVMGVSLLVIGLQVLRVPLLHRHRKLGLALMAAGVAVLAYVIFCY